MTNLFDEIEKNPRALRACKKPISVQVEFAGSDGVCNTLEGEVHFRKGDALLTGTQGERWPIKKDLFFASYEPVPPTSAGENGIYRKLPAVALALQLTERCDVPVSWQDDPLHGDPGDWMIRYADGTFGVVQDSIFRETYAPIEDEGPLANP